MRYSVLSLLLLMTVSMGCNTSGDSGTNSGTERIEPKSYEEKVSYSIGVIASASIIMKLEQSQLTDIIIPEKIVKGINDFSNGGTIEIDPKQAKENLNRFFRKLQEEGSVGKIDEKDKEVLSYSIGVDAIGEITSQLQQSGADSIINTKFVLQAMQHYIMKEELFITVEESQKTVSEYFETAGRKAKEEQLKMYEGNKKSSEEFLAENGKREGVKATQSGLQIETLREGKGNMAKMGDTVEVHYTGTFINGTKFDSSHDRNETYVFVIDYNYPIIQGWVEAAMHMKTGGKYKIYLPSDLAYKDNLNSPIPPFSALIFEIELISINQVDPPSM